MSGPGCVQARELAVRLLGVAREQREALREGRLETFLELMAERLQLFDALVSAGLPPSDDGAKGLLEEILRLDGESAVVLEALLAEMSAETGALAGTHRGIAHYLRDSGRPGSAPGGILEGSF